MLFCATSENKCSVRPQTCGSTAFAHTYADADTHDCCRAPGVIDTGPSVEILAEYYLTPEEQKAQEGRQSVAVAVRDQHLLATAFHPELTSDLRW